MKKFKIIALFLAITLSLGLYACGEPKKVAIESVAISQTEGVVILGGSLKLTATAKKVNGATNSNITWESSNTDIMVVENGVVTAKVVGRAIITAKSSEDASKFATCAVEALASTEISIDTEQVNMVVGNGAVPLIGTIKKEDGTISNTVTWTSSNPAVVTVDENGMLNAISAGSVTITAKANDGKKDLSATCYVVSYPTIDIFTNGMHDGLIYTLRNADNNAKLGYSVTAPNKDITSINILDTYKGLNVTIIEEEAFKECYKVESVKMGKNVVEIGKNAFSAYTVTEKVGTKLVHHEYKEQLFSKLNAKIELNKKVVLAERAFEDSYFTEISIQEGAKVIPAYAFAGSTITTFKFPTSLKEIKGYAFAGCTKLVDANLTSTKLEALGASGNDGISIGNSFFQCGVLANIGTIPAGVKTIEAYTFSGCTNLKQIALSEGLTKIGAQAFLSCANVATISIPKTVKVIGTNAFGRWSNTQTIKVPYAKESVPAGWKADWQGDSCKANTIFG